MEKRFDQESRAATKGLNEAIILAFIQCNMNEAIILSFIQCHINRNLRNTTRNQAKIESWVLEDSIQFNYLREGYFVSKCFKY